MLHGLRISRRAVGEPRWRHDAAMGFKAAACARGDEGHGEQHAPGSCGARLRRDDEHELNCEVNTWLRMLPGMSALLRPALPWPALSSQIRGRIRGGARGEARDQRYRHAITSIPGARRARPPLRRLHQLVMAAACTGPIVGCGEGVSERTDDDDTSQSSGSSDTGGAGGQVGGGAGDGGAGDGNLRLSDHGRRLRQVVG